MSTIPKLAPPPIQSPVLERRTVVEWLEDPNSMVNIGLFTPVWQQWMNNAMVAINALIAGGGGGGGGGSVTSTVYSVTLAADTTINAPIAPAADGDLLFVFITQDGTGGWDITWSTNFAAGAVTDVDGRAGYLTVYAFVGISGSWNEFIPPFMRV